MLKKTKEIAIALAALLVAGLIIGAFMGIIQLPNSGRIKSPSDVSSALTNVSSGIESIGSTLGDIDKSLG